MDDYRANLATLERSAVAISTAHYSSLLKEDQRVRSHWRSSIFLFVTIVVGLASLVAVDVLSLRRKHAPLFCWFDAVRREDDGIDCTPRPEEGRTFPSATVIALGMEYPILARLSNLLTVSTYLSPKQCYFLCTVLTYYGEEITPIMLCAGSSQLEGGDGKKLADDWLPYVVPDDPCTTVTKDDGSICDAVVEKLKPLWRASCEQGNPFYTLFRLKSTEELFEVPSVAEYVTKTQLGEDVKSTPLHALYTGGLLACSESIRSGSDANEFINRMFCPKNRSVPAYAPQCDQKAASEGINAGIGGAMPVVGLAAFADPLGGAIVAAVGLGLGAAIGGVTAALTKKECDEENAIRPPLPDNDDYRAKCIKKGDAKSNPYSQCPITSVKTPKAWAALGKCAFEGKVGQSGG